LCFLPFIITWLVWGRVTRCVFEKGGQNVAQSLCLNYCIIFTAVKSGSKIWATSVNLQKSNPKYINHHPICRRKFAQSGHPGLRAVARHRVPRWVREKVAQTVAQPIFRQT
jgi:hypothetical protein